MKFCLWIVLFLFLLTGTLTQDFDLSDALGDLDKPTPAKPEEQPKPPKQPDGGFGLDLEDAFGPDPTPKPDKPAVKPPKSRGGGGFDLEDAFGPDPTPKPDQPAVKPPSSGGGGGSFDDSDLFDIGGGGEYKPDPGRPGGNPSGGGGDPGYDHNGGADQPQDPDLLWGQILKMLNANMPEELYMWISNSKQTIEQLLQRVLDLLHAMP
ncbi:CD99 molecule isoform X2 [Sparus aurata]|uniref:CD99 molecule isoform X2 n=1 Tax=Sparus aurata TaxID=8175 RepID=UPI0011C1A2AA|nr:CD99 antigen-like isoform X2 [Sparus aurata]